MPAIVLAAILRILAVRDTRDVIEVGDRFVPVPGTGALRPCDRCGRDHEVHVDVELADGRIATIGLGCARGESMEIQAKIKSAVSAAKTRAKLAAQLWAARNALTAAEAAWLEVIALPLPAIEEGEPVPSYNPHRGPSRTFHMGDATVWVPPGGAFDDERRRALVGGWQRRRYEERGFKRDRHSLAAEVRELEDRLAKIEKKIATLTA